MNILCNQKVRPDALIAFSRQERHYNTSNQQLVIEQIEPRVNVLPNCKINEI